ncbi:hypothetical protein NKH57_02280 [Mesorhizobium sp. M1050]|uniref:hypothetical protein n=1 Tax=Mesorhizobium sp. M1050 TaxID=2957051 RepID=UPI003339C557
MRRRKNMSRPTGADAYLGIPATVFHENWIRRTPNYVVHFQRNPFYDPALPPFWELTVGNSRYSYRVILCLPADELETAMRSLPVPSAERHGVDFMRAYKEVILPEDIRRLSGETIMAILIHKVKFAPPGSPYKQGRYYNDADLSRPITQTEADVAANDRRNEALLKAVEVEIASRQTRCHSARMSP